LALANDGAREMSPQAIPIKQAAYPSFPVFANFDDTRSNPEPEEKQYYVYNLKTGFVMTRDKMNSGDGMCTDYACCHNLKLKKQPQILRD
jgi:hypothetical protein